MILPSNIKKIVEYNYRVPQIQYSIADEIFDRFPEFIRGVVVARDVVNRSSPPELVRLLRDAENSLRENLNTENLISHPRIVSWREAFRSLGIKPSEYRPSIEAIARRVIIRNEKSRTLVDIPLTFGVVGALLAPQLAAVGAIAALLSHGTRPTNRPALGQGSARAQGYDGGAGRRVYRAAGRTGYFGGIF
ncbi:MAG: DUF4342 domain-containing protein [Pelolinea sp.]|nr:DUF4342 domain-containing protein [Pelolinea sp.]